VNPYANYARVVIGFCLFLAGSGCASKGQGQNQAATQTKSPAQKPQEFASPQAACDSLVEALRADDAGQLKLILGSGADDILSSGDAAADRADVTRFLALYDAKHSIEPGQDDVSTLVIGPDDWPFPVPIVKSDGGYVFDTDTGREEILNRRIGRNELDAEQVCLAIADAQREYVRLNPTGTTLPEYARKCVSDPGTKNGLYWPTAEGEPESPLGPLVASATAEGYRATGGGAGGMRPYHGYEYRLLTSQGPHADGGAFDYVVDGRLIGGFGVVAYPAQYGNSGIMTFITNHEGIVYQRDLGPGTAQTAAGMTQFDPGPGWSKTTDADKPGQGE